MFYIFYGMRNKHNSINIMIKKFNVDDQINRENQI